ncbi:uncharacterized protein TNCV_4760441 [Trichonephila clavipes]|uniref:DUF4817 domain-containing protein n=1 Tax=Trichonephila clavipes TaxID=2585209 RepID=A0A8X6RML4_TRICX|nr:uncharacterized protein TNCV_4760441 [Trichonephila clavipes]
MLAFSLVELSPPMETNLEERSIGAFLVNLERDWQSEDGCDDGSSDDFVGDVIYEESATIALRKFQVQKNVKSGKGPLTPAGLLKLVKRFEETGKLEDRARAGRPCLKEARAPCIALEMEAIASEAASRTSSARKAARRLSLPPSSVHNILRRILQLYPYKLQSCHELLPADTAQREAFAKWAFSKMEQDPTWVFNILWTDGAHFSLHGDVKGS